MAYIITQLDRTSGNYQDVFIYTLNASFNGIEGEIASARIEFFLPSFCTIYLGDLEFPVQEVRTTEVEGGTQYTIDFGALQDTGIAVRIGFGIVFLLAAPNGTTYTLEPTLWLNGESAERTRSDAITLSVTPEFVLTQEQVLPSADPAAGGFIYYLVTLKNLGDLGASVADIAVTARAGEGITIDDTFEIIGKDITTTEGFADISVNDVRGTVTNGVVRFNLASYRGETYIFLYRALLASTLQTGQEVSVAYEWSIASQAQAGVAASSTLTAPSEAVSLSMYAPTYALPSGNLAYEWRLANTGNQPLASTDCRVTLAQEVQYTEFRTGTFQIRALAETLSAEYQLNYTTAAGQSGSFGTYNMGENTTIALSDFIAAEDNILTLTWSFDTLRIGVSQKTTPRIKGVLRSDLAFGTLLQSETECSWLINVGTPENDARDSRTAAQQTEVQPISVLQPSLSSSIGEAPVRPGDTFRYNISASASASHLHEPIFAMLLPAALAYNGNESISTGSIFGESTPTLPPVQQIENFNAAGDTLLLFAFTDEYTVDFSQRASLTISFEVAVKVGAKGSFGATALLGVLAGSGEVSSNRTAYAGAENIAQGFAVAGGWAQSGTLEHQILFFVATSTQKRVRGLLDDDFAAVGGIGQTLRGGTVAYEITVRNIGNADLQTVEVLDILPYLGDTGVLDVKTARQSDFSVALTGEAAAKVIDQVSGATLANAALAISYSQSTDPVRFGGNFDVIGTATDWQDTAPETMQTVKAIKVGVAQALLPGQALILSLVGLAPVDAQAAQVAWNSFAAQVTYDDINGVRQELLATEARKAGIAVQPLPEDRGEIIGCAWFDENRNGLWEKSITAGTGTTTGGSSTAGGTATSENSGTAGVNGTTDSSTATNSTEPPIGDVGVVLYDTTGTPLQVAFTSTLAQGTEGCYAFGNLEYGRYYVKFFIDDTTYQFTRQRIVENGSNPDSRTGVTAAIEITAENRQAVANVGLLPKEKYKLSDILKANRSARSVVRNVLYNQMLIGMKQDEVLELLK